MQNAKNEQQENAEVVIEKIGCPLQRGAKR